MTTEFMDWYDRRFGAVTYPFGLMCFEDGVFPAVRYQPHWSYRNGKKEPLTVLTALTFPG